MSIQTKHQAKKLSLMFFIKNIFTQQAKSELSHVPHKKAILWGPHWRYTSLRMTGKNVISSLSRNLQLRLLSKIKYYPYELPHKITFLWG